jgi:hypothetical protein
MRKRDERNKAVNQIIDTVYTYRDRGFYEPAFREKIEVIIEELIDTSFGAGYTDGIDAERFWGNIAGEYKE